MIYVVGQAPPSDKYQFNTWEAFKAWERDLPWWEFDIETVAADQWKGKELRTVQFGHEDIQWVIEPFRLTYEQQLELIEIIGNPRKLKLIHNAYFELVIFLLYGVRISNIYCTMLGEKLLTCGDDLAGCDLASLCERYLGLEISKEEQKNFGDGNLTESKVIYAATDVQVIKRIMDLQVPKLLAEDLEYVMALELDAVLSYAQISANGMPLDAEKWRENITLAEPLVQKAKRELDAWLQDPLFKSEAVRWGYVSDEDRLTINWNSPQQKNELLQRIIPGIPGSSQGVLKGYRKTLQDGHPHIPMIDGLMSKEKNYKPLMDTLLSGHREWLIDCGYLIPAGMTTINWNSRDQVLPVFRLVQSDLLGLSTDDLAEFPHPISDRLSEYKDSMKLISSYGEAFIQKHMEIDGCVRTSINQVLNTGRISSRNPNMQQIPAKEEVGNRYRNCFITPKGWKYVDTDYASQELVVIAFLSGDPVWREALDKGQDLHSVCAELVFGSAWKQGAEPGCAYYEVNEKGELAKQKCKCKKHKHLRGDIKPINFGLAYGMSHFKLSRTLGITPAAAQTLIDKYFTVFPKIRDILEYYGRFAVENGYIMTIAPFFRKRWFPLWKNYRGAINYHLAKIKFNKTLGMIERAGKNTPIQGTSADCAKLSICMIRWYIEDNNLQDSIKLAQQVHDQNTTMTREEVAEWWAPKQDRLMRNAADVIITNKLLGAETNVTEVWTK